jgi:pantetheine-phosphate adenylyltransferase
MTVAMYPGRFDPVTNGHMDIVLRASELFDAVVLAVADSRSTLFTTDERRELCESAIAEAELPNVRVISYTGLTVNQAREQGAAVLVRGIRALTDFSNEFDQALMNKKMAPEIESVFLMTSLEHLFISGTRIRELAGLGYHIDDMVPSAAAAALKAKYNHR